jgi:hypothetical protein
MTGANVHRLKELAFIYEQAVSLHNDQHPSHLTYRREHETRLRCYVVQCGIGQLDRKIMAARRYSESLSEANDRLHGRIEIYNELWGRLGE